jgi:hypothetical protein
MGGAREVNGGPNPRVTLRRQYGLDATEPAARNRQAGAVDSSGVRGRGVSIMSGL